MNEFMNVIFHGTAQNSCQKKKKKSFAYLIFPTLVTIVYIYQN